MMAPRTRGPGFTLLEMLVVVVIAAILVSMAVVTLGANPHAKLDDEGERLAQLFEAANDEAHLRAHVWAWQPDPLGYRFLERRDGAWVPRSEAPFEPRKWPEGFLNYSIQLEGSPQSQSQILFGSEAIEAPVVLTLEGLTQSVRVFATGDGHYETR